jgi:23S rRNA (uridine2552-2'-O)-methyltransferase
MSHRDHYYNKAKQEGYRARSAYKLKQLDEAEGLLGEGRTVVDLGAAPGGWLQVAAEAVGERGAVVGVDRQRIDPLDDDHGARVEYVRGDVTDESTREAILERVGAAGDAADAARPDRAGGPVDVVLSDMAPNVTGAYETDHARSVHLARRAFETAEALLSAGGDFGVKVFEGRDLDDYRADLEPSFEYVRTLRPDASRDSSSEVYLVGKRYLTAPVRTGDELTVDVVDEGSDGDGVAKVEGYTLFVAGASEGETVDVEVTDLTANYGFAERVE